MCDSSNLIFGNPSSKSVVFRSSLFIRETSLFSGANIGVVLTSCTCLGAERDTQLTDNDIELEVKIYNKTFEQNGANET